MSVFTKIYRIGWLILFLLLIFFDRENLYLISITLLLLFLLASIAILRALESRRQWREYIKEEGLDGEPVPKSKNVRSYMLPPLESCRETWDQNFNQTTDWPEIYEIPF